MSDGAAVDLSLLIATRRRPAELERALTTLAAMDPAPRRWQLVVIDNAGDRETKAVVDRFAERLPVAYLVEPVAGKNRALNRGLSIATGALIAFTDDDVSVDPRWLIELTEGAARWPDASIFGGRILPRWPEREPPPMNRAFFEHAYAVADFDLPEGEIEAGYVWGPNMAIRGDVFRNGRRFDERIGPDGTRRYMPGSETSLTVALAREGHRAVYLPRAIVHHHIRDEQVTPAWLYGRAFRKGRADARKLGLGGTRGVPRRLIVQAGREYLAWIASIVRRDRASSVDRGVAYWTTRGMIHQCRTASAASSSTERA